MKISLRFRLGCLFLKWGSRICLDTKEQKERFKNKINNNSKTGSVCGSGDHIRGHLSPMNDFDTQSVVNVLTQGLLVYGDIWEDDHVCTEKVDYYQEVWND